LFVSFATLLLVAGMGAPASGQSLAGRDPRQGLKAGVQHPGIASRGLILTGHVDLPAGFVDPHLGNWPEQHFGSPPKPPYSAPPERPFNIYHMHDAPKPSAAKKPGPPAVDSFAYINTDLAFSGERLVMGNYGGFLLYDLSSPDRPRLITAVACPGGENDVAIYGHLVFLGTQDARARVDCRVGGDDPIDSARFRGVRIFDISDVRMPRQIAAVQTCQGSHTFTLLPSPADRRNLYIYNSGLNGVRPAAELAGCSDKSPSEDPNTSFYSIDVIKVPLDAPQDAEVIGHPRVFADPKTGKIDSLTEGGYRGPNAVWSYPAYACHDITVYPAIGRAGAACIGAGLLLDISNPADPKRVDWVTDPKFGAWHSATFNNDASTLIFTDEWGSGTLPNCQPEDPAFWGGDGIWALNHEKLQRKGYYKIPSVQSAVENCVAHNGGLVPVPGRDILVQAWYQGGVSVMDFTDPAHPFELAYFDRGPISPTLHVAGMWSAYWYNGRIYGSDIVRGLDVYRLKPTPQLTANEIAAAELVRVDQSNPQTQDRIVWPKTPVVARAYLDQLVREKAIAEPDRAQIEAALRDLERGAANRQHNASLAEHLDILARSATRRNAERLEGIAEILQ
jgi:hypothetical protein